MQNPKPARLWRRSSGRVLRIHGLGWPRHPLQPEVKIAAALGVTDRTVRRDWKKAKLLLAATLRA